MLELTVVIEEILGHIIIKFGLAVDE